MTRGKKKIINLMVGYYNIKEIGYDIAKEIKKALEEV